MNINMNLEAKENYFVLPNSRTALENTTQANGGICTLNLDKKELQKEQKSQQ